MIINYHTRGKMRIGFEFRDDNYSKKDFTNLDNGNPGVGGTQYEFVLLAHHLKKVISDIELIFFHKGINLFENFIEEITYTTVNQIPKLAEENDIDILIFWTMHDQEWYEELSKYNVSAIGWAHNFINYFELSLIAKNKNIKSLVAVSKEQYELLSAEDCFYKTTYIYNMYDYPVDLIEMKDVKQNIVCYMGALVEPKGFHVLAKIWKDVIKEVPNAKLYVIGSGRTYNDNAVLGKYGISDEKYEKKFMRYLTDEQNNIIDSVRFFGNLGLEKYEIIKQAKVGVVNPTGYSETFCISAVEMQAVGVPICTVDKYGLKNTVIHNETGLLSKSNSDLKTNIVKILNNNDLCRQLSKNAQYYAVNFRGNKLVAQWIELIENVYNNAPIRKIHVENHKIRQKIGLLRAQRFFSWIVTPYHIEYMYFQLNRKMKDIIKKFINRK